MTTETVLVAARAFVYINVAETKGASYISRLANAVKLMNCDEEAFELFTKWFDDETIVTHMIHILEGA